MTIVLMLMHVGCGTMKCGSTTALVMAVGFSYTRNKNIHFEKILDVGIGEKRKETRFLI